MKVDCLYVNGDSWAYGAGLDESRRLSQCWPSLVAHDIGLELILKAKGGSSNHRIVRTSVQDIQELINNGRKPLVLISWTFPHRYELCRLDNNEWAIFSGTGHDDDAEIADLITSRYNSDIGNMEVFGTQLLLMQAFLKEKQIPYLFVPTFRIEFEVLPKHLMENLSKGVDLKYFMHDFSLRSYLNSFNDIDWIKDHPGPEGHKIISDFLVTQINRRKLCTQ